MQEPRALPDAHQKPEIGGCLYDVAEQCAPQIHIQSKARDKKINGNQPQTAAEQIQQECVQRLTQPVQNAAERSGQKEKRTHKAEADNIGARQFIVEQNGADEASEEQKAECTAKP